jgi:superfamily I DNA and/or RNA helicase
LLYPHGYLMARVALLGMVRARKWVLVGDHYQLPPVFKTLEEAVEQPEAVDPLSAFNRLIKLAGEERAVWLKTHYRSNPAIIRFASERVYGGRVAPHPSCGSIKLKIEPRGYLSRILDPEKPAVFVHVDGQEQAEAGVGSRWNEKEVEAAKAIVAKLIELGGRERKNRRYRALQSSAQKVARGARRGRRSRDGGRVPGEGEGRGGVQRHRDRSQQHPRATISIKPSAQEQAKGQ